jgi:hypothetical protein
VGTPATLEAPLTVRPEDSKNKYNKKATLEAPLLCDAGTVLCLFPIGFGTGVLLGWPEGCRNLKVRHEHSLGYVGVCDLAR